MDVQGKRVLVVGLARSGLAVATALARRGAVVTVTDHQPPVVFRDVLPELLKQKMGLELGSQRLETFLRHEVIVISPGVPWDLPQLKAARERQIPVYPEVEAASWFLEGTLVGVTGSNGKTTTTSLLGDMLKASGLPTFVGGNIGNPLSAAVDHAPTGTNFVTELSSFQLEGIQNFHPQVAVMLNLSPNHLDRHPSLEAYAEAKRQIFRNQGENDYAVLNADDPWVAGLKSTVASQPVLFSRNRELPDGVFVSGDKIYYRVGYLERVLFETRDVTLRGDFNLEDVLAATTAACLLGADFSAIRKAVRAFRAVEHRLEFVREIQGVDFYNNSKATSIDATAKSLAAFEGGVHLILGGKDKGAPYTPLIPLIKDCVRDIMLIGAAAPVIAEQLAGAAELVQAGDLSTAVFEAFARAERGDTVLLAPACSSFDQFQDYEERGRVFKELVGQLANDVATGAVSRAQRTAAAAPPPPSAETPATEGVPGLEAVNEPPPAVVPDVAAETGKPPGFAETPQRMVPGEPPTRPDGQETSPTLQSADVLELPSCSEAIPENLVQEKPAEVSKDFDTTPTVQIADVLEVRVANSGPSERPQQPPAAKIPSVPIQFPDEHVLNITDLLDAVDLRPPGPVSRVAEAEISRREHREEKLAGSPSESAGAHEPPMRRAVGHSSTAPQHSGLTYVYELDTIETTGTESQAAFEEEPEVYVLAGPSEVLDDEILPFESRPSVISETEAESPTVEAAGAENGLPPPPRQPRLSRGGKE